MTKSPKIALIILYFISDSVDSQTPTETLNNFCPCRPQNACNNVFGNSQAGFEDILKAIPACLAGEVRCCNKNDMVEGLMTILHQNANAGLLGPPPPSPLLGGGSRLAGGGAGGLFFPPDQQDPGVLGAVLGGPGPGQGTTGGVAQNVPGLGTPDVLGLGTPGPTGAADVPGATRVDNSQGEGRQGGVAGASAGAFGAAAGAPGGAFGAAAGASAGSFGAAAGASAGAFGGAAGASAGAAAGGATGGGPGGSVQCVSADLCRPENIYGTNPQHFLQYGFISPSQTKCFTDSGNILCVVAGGGSGGSGAPAPPAAPAFPAAAPAPLAAVPTAPAVPAPTFPAAPSASTPLPCVAVASCTEPFGTKGAHFAEYGVQTACPSISQVRCVTAQPAQPTQPATRPTAPPTRPTPPPTSPTRPSFRPTPVTASPVVPLPCLPVTRCLEPFGIKGAHFAQFGSQPVCPDRSNIRCVRQRPVQPPQPPVHTPQPPVHTPTPPVHTHRPPLFPPQQPHGQAPGPVAPSVHIIGPQPVYVTYNNIKGPSVGGGGHGGYGGDSPGTVESHGVNSSQELQINSLLQALKQKLRNILGQNLH